MAHAEGLRDRHLMLVHGLIDENVHFRHSARLINALIAARIPYELFLLPDERHSPRGRGRSGVPRGAHPRLLLAASLNLRFSGHVRTHP